MNPYLMTEKMVERQKMEEEFDKNAALYIQKQKILKIESFTGYFEFLSNNYLTPVYYEGILYPSVTHAFHAARSSDDTTRKAIINAENLTAVVKIAKRIRDPEKWHQIRTKVMDRLVRDKFRRSKELQEKLKATSSREIVNSFDEETTNNLFWGIVKAKGQNQLGRILMRIRDDIKEEKEMMNWITYCFDFADISLLPEISLTVNKNNNPIDHIVLKNKPFYILGILPSSDVILQHPSVSRTHAVIICDKNLGVVLIDLRSKAGTRLDGDNIRDHIPYRLKDGKKINFASSTRDYIININTENLKKIYEKEKLRLQDDKELLRKLDNPDASIIKKSFGLANEDNDNIFVNHIPVDAVDEEIKNLFNDKFGEIKNFKCPVDHNTGFKKGFAFIQFYNKEHAKEAVDYGIIGYKESMFLKIKYAEPLPDWGRNTNNRTDHKSNKEDVRKHMVKELKNGHKSRDTQRRRRKSSSSSSSESDSGSSSGSSSSSGNNSSDNSSSSSSSSTIKKQSKRRSRSRNKASNRKRKN